MIHAVKATPEFFEDVISGKKPFEVRLNDRNYMASDYLALNEVDSGGYVRRSAVFEITYVLYDPRFCKEGYAVLGITPCQVARVEELTAAPIIYGYHRSSKEPPHE